MVKNIITTSSFTLFILSMGPVVFLVALYILIRLLKTRKTISLKLWQKIVLFFSLFIVIFYLILIYSIVNSVFHPYRGARIL